MIRIAGESACRVDVPEDIRSSGTIERADYEVAWDVTIADGDPRSAEQWIRSMLEGAPRLLRSVILFGWIAGLGFRMGPRPSPDHVLGWKILDRSPELIVLSVEARVVGTSQFLLRVEDSKVVLVNLVQYERPWARAVWTMVKPVHQRVVPYLLGHAAHT